jgi:hypothetical protein
LLARIPMKGRERLACIDLSHPPGKNGSPLSRGRIGLVFDGGEVQGDRVRQSWDLLCLRAEPVARQVLIADCVASPGLRHHGSSSLGDALALPCLGQAPRAGDSAQTPGTRPSAGQRIHQTGRSEYPCVQDCLGRHSPYRSHPLVARTIPGAVRVRRSGQCRHGRSRLTRDSQEATADRERPYGECSASRAVTYDGGAARTSRQWWAPVDSASRGCGEEPTRFARGVACRYAPDTGCEAGGSRALGVASTEPWERARRQVTRGPPTLMLADRWSSEQAAGESITRCGAQSPLIYESVIESRFAIAS